MKIKFALIACLMTSIIATGSDSSIEAITKPNASEALKMLINGNNRFIEGKRISPNSDSARIVLASKSNQGNYAYATILSCSDSRVPVEIIFDAGIMELFVIRVAGNECGTPQVGSFEYGAFHVNTPLIVVLGHSQCGAVTAVTDAVCGHGHALEENIPATVEPIIPTVKQIVKDNPSLKGKDLINKATEACVKSTIYDSLVRSPALRDGVKSDKIQIVGAIYELETGKVKFMPNKGKETCLQAEKDAKCIHHEVKK